MSDSNMTDYEPHTRYRHTEAPEHGHGQLVLDEVRKLEASGQFRREPVAQARFESRFGNLFASG